MTKRSGVYKSMTKKQRSERARNAALAMHQQNPTAAARGGKASAKKRLPNKKAREAWGKALAKARWT